MCRRVHLCHRQARVGHLCRIVEETEAYACLKQTLQRGVHLALFNQPALHSARQAEIRLPAGRIRTRLHASSGGLLLLLGEVVTDLCIKVVNRAAVRRHKATKAPVAAQNLLEKHIAGARGLAVDGVVGAHDGVRLAFDNRRTKSGKVRIPEIVLAYVDVEAMASALRSAVDGKVLRRRNRTEVRGVIALDAANEGRPHAGGKKRIFSVRLLATSPSRIAKDIDIRRPDRQAKVDGMDAMLNG